MSDQTREQLHAELEWISDLLHGRGVSDFALSFPLVRAIADLQAALDAARQRERALERALEAFVSKLDAMEKPVNACIAVSAVHEYPYSGPNWGDEVTAAKSILAALAQKEQP